MLSICCEVLTFRMPREKISQLHPSAADLLPLSSPAGWFFWNTSPTPLSTSVAQRVTTSRKKKKGFFFFLKHSDKYQFLLLA